MAIFRGLDLSSKPDISSSDALARPELTQLATAGKNNIEAKLGLSDSGRLVLEIIKIAQSAKRHRKDCTYIADQAYQLVNAVDGGVKGRAIDINNILRDHVARLNQDLQQIRKIMKNFASWWILFRDRGAPRGLRQCHDLLNHGMDMYLLLLRYSLSKPAPQPSAHRRNASVDNPTFPAMGQAARADRHRTFPLPRARPYPVFMASATQISQSPY